MVIHKKLSIFKHMFSIFSFQVILNYIVINEEIWKKNKEEIVCLRSSW